MLLYDIWLSDGRGSMHSEFKGQMESFAELGLKEWKDLAVERRGEDAQSNGREAECVFFPFFFPLHFPPFPFPKLESTKRDLRMKIMVWRCVCSNIIKEIIYFFTFSIIVTVNLGL